MGWGGVKWQIVFCNFLKLRVSGFRVLVCLGVGERGGEGVGEEGKG